LKGFFRAAGYVPVSARLPERKDIDMQEAYKPPMGSLRISHDVIATIASCAAAEIEGVASLASYTKSINNLKGILFKSQVTSSISVELNDDIATIGVYLNLKYGAKIPVVAERVQQAVRDAVQSMTA
jgi:uncharacterized alkaline shock family protein YloU